MSATFMLLVLIVSVTLPLRSQEKAPYPSVPADVSSVATLVSRDEKGERLVVSGTIYRADNKTPFRNLVLYIYQTDATGVYNEEDRGWMRPRIHGWVKTDKNGRYEIRTIKPGSYPGGQQAAHIHAIVKLPDSEAKWIEDFLFEGDPFLKHTSPTRTGDSFSHIMKVSRDSEGVLRCRRDISLTSPR